VKAGHLDVNLRLIQIWILTNFMGAKIFCRGFAIRLLTLNCLPLRAFCTKGDQNLILASDDHKLSCR
jgi:hypothetical protein